ncbi:MAG: ABC transporter ATP-binding protein/permease [Clostridia bacterium]|nr:ABC transporter ATP-binding protein/permease [Clostridia bacterium]
MPPPGRRFKNEPQKLSSVIKDTSYALKLMWKVSPVYVLGRLLANSGFALWRTFFQRVYFLRELMLLITNGAEFGEYMRLLTIFTVLSLVAYALETIGDYIWDVQAKNIYKGLNRMIFDKASKADLACYEDPKYYNVYQRATEVVSESYYSSFIWDISEIVSTLVSLVALISYIMTVDVRITVVLLLILPVFYFEARRNKLNYKMDREMTPYRREKAYVQRVVFLRDYAKDMRTSDIYSVMRSRFDAAVEKNREVIRKYGWKTGGLELLNNLLSQVIPSGVAYGYGAYRFMVSKDLEVADFTVLVTAVNSAINSIRVMASALASVQSSALYFGNFREFMNYENRIVSGDRGIEKIESIEFRDVTFTYPGADRPSLRGVSLKIDRGQTVAIVGRNGAGKTTFVKLLLRFYDPDCGVILVNGVDIKEYDLSQLRALFGTVFQDYKVFALSVNENVLCRETETDADRELSREALVASGAWDKVSALPDGAETVLTREFDPRGSGLSGGEQQKVAAARMFAHAFDVAVLDEPSSALDPIAEYKMYEALMEKTLGRTAVYISHRLSSATLSDRIFVFENGTVVQSGSHEELMNAGGLYADMFTMQAQSYRKGGEDEDGARF